MARYGRTNTKLGDNAAGVGVTNVITRNRWCCKKNAFAYENR